MIASPRAVDPRIRDEFLAALDSNDAARARQLADYLMSCTNRLPGVTCAYLGLPPGSCYSQAAERVVNGYVGGGVKPDMKSLAALAKGTMT